MATRENLKEQLVLYITDGSCIHGDQVFKGCNLVLKYNHGDMQPVYDILELKIRLLEALGPMVVATSSLVADSRCDILDSE